MRLRHLTVEDFRPPLRWRWILADEHGAEIARHDVRLDYKDEHLQAFLNLPAYLRHHIPKSLKEVERERRRRTLLSAAGDWVAREIFGGLFESLEETPAGAPAIVTMGLAGTAELRDRPFELIRLGRGAPTRRTVRFVHRATSDEWVSGAGDSRDRALRVLAVFSVPEGAQPLGLRLERSLLEREIERLRDRERRDIELQVLQYGATRRSLRETLTAEAGWDVIHFSGHGLAGEIVLEDALGRPDRVARDELVTLLLEAGPRTRLVTLSCCLSGAATLRIAEELLELDDSRAGAPRSSNQEVGQITRHPSLAHAIARDLGCAVLAMRFSLEDEFASAAVLRTFLGMFEERESLPIALERTLEEQRSTASALSLITPILVGDAAVDLRLVPAARARAARGRYAPEHLPAAPDRFVGRLGPMLKATSALASGSDRRVVVFHGMAGTGKTACAIELCHRGETSRFDRHVWHRCSSATLGTDLEGDFDRFSYALDPQSAPTLGVSHALRVLSTTSVLAVLDNAEDTLSPQGAWLDDRWKQLFAGLLQPARCPSRIVLTARRIPTSLQGHSRVLALPLHPLSWDECLVLTRQLHGLRSLFGTEEGVELLKKILTVTQGHPQLLEIADRAASNRELLRRFLGRSLAGGDETGEARKRSSWKDLLAGSTAEAAEGEVLESMKSWALQLKISVPESAQRVIEMLSRLEDEDRDRRILPVIARTLFDHGDPAAAVSTLESHLDQLAAVGLVDLPPSSTAIRLHPAIAGAIRASLNDEARSALDAALADFWMNVALAGFTTEMTGGGGALLAGARRAIPYLWRIGEWETLALLSEQLADRDSTPRTLHLIISALERIDLDAVEPPIGQLVVSGHAKALLLAGRPAEAERRLRSAYDRAVADRDPRAAAVFLGHRVNALRHLGRYNEALSLAEDWDTWARKTAPGPRSELAGLGFRLSVLKDMGETSRVLNEVLLNKKKILALKESHPFLPTEPGLPVLQTWQIQEALLDTGRSAALRLERWRTSLKLNSHIVEIERRRGAHPTMIAKRQLNDVSALIGLHQTAEARQLAGRCRSTLEEHEDIDGLSILFGLLALIEHRDGHAMHAVAFQELALAWEYQIGDAGRCAAAHLNLGSYLREVPGEEHASLCHWLSALYIESRSAHIMAWQGVINIALHASPDDLLGLEDVASVVDRVDGVRFTKWFSFLPDGDWSPERALEEIRSLVRRERREISSRRERGQKSEPLPPEIQAALDSHDMESLEAVLLSYDPKVALGLWQSMEIAGLVRQTGSISAASVSRTTSSFAVLLGRIDDLRKSVVAVSGLPEAQEAIRLAVLPEFEAQGFRIGGAVQRMWRGERDEDELTRGLAPKSASLVRLLLRAIREAR